MHALIITPSVVHSTLIQNALERQNIKSFACTPSSLSKDWCPATDALIFPHPLNEEHWKSLIPFLFNVSPKLPLIFLTKVDSFLFEERKFQSVARQTIVVDQTLSIDEIPIVIKDLISKHPAGDASKKITVGNFILDRSQRTAIHNGNSTILTKKEFFLLELLAQHVNQVITRDLIIDNLWDKNTYVEANAIDVMISRLRKKLHVKRTDTLIRTIPSLGYLLAVKK